MSSIVHGGIRHLEKSLMSATCCAKVHGGIRHLESKKEHFQQKLTSSWRHTPFRNCCLQTCLGLYGSWRHTPFRKLEFSSK